MTLVLRRAAGIVRVVADTDDGEWVGTGMLDSEHAREHGLQCDRVGRDQSDSFPQQSCHELFSPRNASNVQGLLVVGVGVVTPTWSHSSADH